MKFYIDGKLVRTSKTHAYTHALLHDDCLFSCHGSYEQATKAMNREIARRNENIANYTAAIKAIDEGRTTFWWKYGRERWKAEVAGTREKYEAEIALIKEGIACLHIRELEAR